MNGPPPCEKIPIAPLIPVSMDNVMRLPIEDARRRKLRDAKLLLREEGKLIGPGHPNAGAHVTYV